MDAKYQRLSLKLKAAHANRSLLFSIRWGKTVQESMAAPWEHAYVILVEAFRTYRAESIIEAEVVKALYANYKIDCDIDEQLLEELREIKYTPPIFFNPDQPASQDEPSLTL